MPTQLQSYNPVKLEPIMFPQDARLDAGRFGASLTIAKGTVLGKKTSDSKLYAYVQPNRVQTLAIGGTLSAGGFRLLFIDKDGVEQVTPLIAYNANTAAIQAAIDAVIPQVAAASVVVAGGTAITATTLTFSGTGYAGKPQELVRLLPDGLTGMTTGSITDSTTLIGTEVPVGICQCTIKTDASGNVYFSDDAVPSTINPPHATAPLYVNGTFDTADLTGWDAAAATALKARTLNSGFVQF